MNDKIKEVQDYFKAKILNGDYEINNRTEWAVEVLVDGKYLFTLWMANKDYGFRLYDMAKNFMDFELTEDEKVKGYNQAIPVYIEYKKTELLAIKRAEFERLENELKQS